MKKTIHPKGDRVLIRPLTETETTYGSILIPDLGKERPEIGEVIGVGPGRLSEFGHWIPVNTHVGDKVMIPKIGTIRIELEGEEFYITQEKEILAIINETNE
jgi:chaperonin GroES